MTALNKQALRQLAEKATPGPWEMEHENIWFRDAEGYTKHLMYAYQGDDVDDQQDHDNTAYIAAFNPKVVLALLDELEAKDKQIAELEARDKPKFVQCWSCKHDIEVLAIADCDGYCPRCAAPIDLDDEPYAAAGKGE